MEIEFFGANCFRVASKKASLIFDDNLADLGVKTVTKNGDVALFGGAHGEPQAPVKLTIDQPGEYEVSNVSIQGIAARSHLEEQGKKSATIYKVMVDDIRLAVLGHIYPDLSDQQLEAIGTVDVLIVPVGNTGYTLDGEAALKVIKKIEPKIVIPSHYADKSLKYEVPQQDLDSAIKALSMEPKDRLAKLKIKPTDLASDGTQLIILERQ